MAGLLVIAALALVPASADADQRRRNGSNDGVGEAEQNDRGRRTERTEQSTRRGADTERRTERAVPRSSAPTRVEPAPQYQAPRRVEPARRSEIAPRSDQGRRIDGRPFYWYSPRGGYATRTIIVPRYVSPRVVTVVPYRPYVYRPSIAVGTYYGAGGAYPYGYTPRGYYDPIPGRVYGGLRIAGAPRDAQVFADGYYVGIVNDFDGVFQHLNLEAGPHRIEIAGYGFAPVAFDVMIQAGRTITFRADGYGNY
jgi:hypothetical protein